MTFAIGGADRNGSPTSDDSTCVESYLPVGPRLPSISVIWFHSQCHEILTACPFKSLQEVALFMPVLDLYPPAEWNFTYRENCNTSIKGFAWIHSVRLSAYLFFPFLGGMHTSSTSASFAVSGSIFSHFVGEVNFLYSSFME